MMVTSIVAAVAAASLWFGSSDPVDPQFHHLSGDGDFSVDGSSETNSGGNGVTTSNTTSGPPTEYVRAPRCTSTIVRQDQTPTCPNNDPITVLCLDGSDAELPIWFRTQNTDGTWTDWSIVRDYYCPGDAALLAAIQHEWTQLQPQPSDINLEPNTGWVIATVPTAEGARTSFFIPQANKLYVAVLHRGNQKAALRVFEPDKP